MSAANDGPRSRAARPAARPAASRPADKGRAATSLPWSTRRVGGKDVSVAEAGSGPTVLFVHGWALGHRTYERPLLELAERGYHVVAPALPGFGESEAIEPKRTSFAGFGEWLVQLADEMNLADVVIAGHSFGGGVATGFAAAAPRRVRHLVLVNSVGGFTDDSEGAAVVDKPIWRWISDFAAELRLPLDRLVDFLPAYLSDAVPNMLRSPLVMAQTAAQSQSADLLPELRSIRASGIPITVVWTERDQLVPRAAFEVQAQAAGGRTKIADGGHGWVISHPETFADVIHDVISSPAAADAKGPAAKDWAPSDSDSTPKDSDSAPKDSAPKRSSRGESGRSRGSRGSR